MRIHSTKDSFIDKNVPNDFWYYRRKQMYFLLHTSHPQTHELQTSNEAFFHQNPKLLVLGRQFGQINFGAFGGLSAPILVL